MRKGIDAAAMIAAAMQGLETDRRERRDHHGNDQNNADQTPSDEARSDQTSGDTLARPQITQAVTRGAARTLIDLGYAPLVEFVVPDGLRADIAALDARGQIWIIEVKSCLDDLRADAKWPGYHQWCDRFSFAVPPEFDITQLPANEGVIVADGFSGAQVRAPIARPMPSARRKAVLIRFARAAALASW